MIRSIVRFWVVMISCVYFSPFAASASSIFFDLDRIDDFVFPMDEFAVFIEVEIDAPGVTDVTVTMGTLSIPMELTPDGTWEDANDTVFPSLAALRSAVDGTWTIMITGGADASTSIFEVNANGLVDGDFPPTATGLSPADGATGISATTPLSWIPIPVPVRARRVRGKRRWRTGGAQPAWRNSPQRFILATSACAANWPGRMGCLLHT